MPAMYARRLTLPERSFLLLGPRGTGQDHLAARAAAAGPLVQPAARPGAAAADARSGIVPARGGCAAARIVGRGGRGAEAAFAPERNPRRARVGPAPLAVRAHRILRAQTAARGREPACRACGHAAHAAAYGRGARRRAAPRRPAPLRRPAPGPPRAGRPAAARLPAGLA